KVTREMARIDWAAPAPRIAQTIRAYDPKPGAWTTLRNVETRVFGARAVHTGSGKPGEVLHVGPAGMTVAAGSDAVLVSLAQPAGRKRLAPHDLVTGRGLSPGDVLGE